ncbi:hypothetical protein QEH58_15055 [Roseibacillus persicicus]|nr:hypothetical protein [Roseibacillus persicicus]
MNNSIVAAGSILLIGSFVIFSIASRAKTTDELTEKVSFTGGVSRVAENDSKKISRLGGDEFPSIHTANDIYNFEVSNFGDSWDYIQKKFPAGERVMWLAQIVSRMSRLGDSKTAIDFIHRDFGAGDSRNVLISACFANISSFELAERAFETLEHEDEKAAARKGLENFFTQEMAGTSRSIFFNDYKDSGIPNLEDVFRGAASQYLLDVQAGGGTEEEMKIAFDSILEMGFDENLESKILVDLSTRVPFLSWEQIENRELGTENKIKVLGDMMSHDPEKAFELLQSSSGNENLFKNGVLQWIRTDAKAPIEWYSKNAASLSAEQANMVVAGIAHYATTQGEMETAQRWIDELREGDEKKAANYRLWKVKKSEVVKAVKSNPQKAMKDLVSGKSQFEKYYIEAAMDEWSRLDKDAPGEWFSKNERIIDNSTRQYFAAAFAKQAISQGDTMLARRWAGLIQDEKTSTRINGIIEKTEQAASN